MTLAKRHMLLALIVSLLNFGCQTKHPPRSLASIEAHDLSIDGLSQGLLRVFHEDGFTPVRNSPTDYVFEKRAGHMNQIAYGGLLDGAVWLRVKVHVAPLGPSSTRLTADAFRVRDHGDSLEEEEPIGRTQARHYRELLKAAIRQRPP